MIKIPSNIWKMICQARNQGRDMTNIVNFLDYWYWEWIMQEGELENEFFEKYKALDDWFRSGKNQEKYRQGLHLGFEVVEK